MLRRTARKLLVPGQLLLVASFNVFSDKLLRFPSSLAMTIYEVELS